MTSELRPPPVILRDLTREFHGVVAVDHVSLELAEGTILGMIGPSGSGKSTVVRMLTGIIKPTSGFVQVLGEDPHHFRRQTRERIGYMPQLFLLYPELTVSENLSFVASLFGMLWRRRRQRVRQVLELVGLTDARGRRARQLSGGMQRRLALACALVHEPSLLFVDEPSAGIDPVLRQTIWNEFRRLRDEGRTLFVTTQYVSEAEYCDQVALLAAGRLLALAPPEELRREALGGEVIEIETARAVDASTLCTVQGVKDARQRGPRNVLVVAEDAGVATPRVLQTLTGQGVEVVSSHEYHPTFDEVFTELVARKQAQQVQGEHSDRAA